MKIITLKFAILLSVIFFTLFFTASLAFAVGTNSENKAGDTKKSIVQQDTELYIREAFPGEDNKIDVSAQTGSIGILAQYVGSIYKFIAALSVIIAVLVFMAAGYMMMFSGGDSGAKETAKTMIQQVMMGIALLFLSGLILNFVNPKFYVFGGGNTSQDDITKTEAQILQQAEDKFVIDAIKDAKAKGYPIPKGTEEKVRQVYKKTSGGKAIKYDPNKKY